MFALGFLRPGAGRVLGSSRIVDTDPLSLAPFVATAAIAGSSSCRSGCPRR